MVPLPTTRVRPARESVRAVLRVLADTAAGTRPPGAGLRFANEFGGAAGLAAWVSGWDLAPVAHAACGDHDAELRGLLAPATHAAAAANLVHFETLSRIERRFCSERIDMVLLKGAAIAGKGYADRCLRPMTDVDIWVPRADMPRATRCLEDDGFDRRTSLRSRPEELQQHSGGEIAFRRRDGGYGLVELHYSAFQGWWVRRTAEPDLDAVWDRSEPSAPGRHARALSTEDAILQTAFHVVVNQFGQAPLRGMMDLAVLARTRELDWTAVASRAKAWRLATATWVVLDATARLFGIPGGGTAIEKLRPSRRRRALLAAFVGRDAWLDGRGLTRPAVRYPFMLALADRQRDRARLLARTLWPEAWWIAARYGRPGSRLGHVWGIVRRGDI